MSLKTYDPKLVTISVNGNLITGFADGSFVNLDRSENNFALTVGADGEGARAKTNNRSGLLTLTLMQTAISNLVLSKLAGKDETDNSGVFPVVIADDSNTDGDTKFSSAKGWIEKPAPAEFAKGISNRAWAIMLYDVRMDHGGNPVTEALSA